MLTCQNCGIEIKLDNTTSCPGCGTKITTATVKSKKDSAKETKESPVLENKKEKEKQDEWIVQEEHVDSGLQSKPSSSYTPPSDSGTESSETENKEIDFGDVKAGSSVEEEIPMPKISKIKKKSEDDDISIQNPIEAIMEDKPATPDKHSSTDKITPQIKPTLGEKIAYTESAFASPGYSKPTADEDINDDETPPTGTPTTLKKMSDILPKYGHLSHEPTEFKREAHVSHSRGVAFLDKNKIRLTGGFKAYPGDVVKVGEQEYVLKTFKKNNLPVYIAASALVVFLVVLMVVIGSSPTKNSGNLVGIVLEKGSQALLPNATVKINELGKKVVTDNLGFFQFDLLPPGSYTLEASLGGYSSTQNSVTVTKKKTSNLALVLVPTSQDLYSRLDLKEGSTTPPVNLQTPAKTERVGSIKIQSNVSNALVMLDNNMLGVGNKTFGNITPGPYTLRVTKENYQDWESKIEVKSGATQTFSVDLNPLKTQTPKFTKPQTYEDYLTLANAEYKEGNYNKAASYYSGALSIKTKSGEALMGRADSYLKLQDKKKAVTDYYAAGKIFQDNNNNSKAIEAYTSIIEISESNTNAFYERGNCYLETGQFDRSIKDFEIAISESPKFFLAYLRLGYAHYKAEDYKESVDAYDKARKLNPNSKQVYIGLAKTYQAMGSKSNAKKNYEKFRELTTYVDREALKDDPEWKAVLDFIGVKEDH